MQQQCKRKLSLSGNSMSRRRIIYFLTVFLLPAGGIVAQTDFEHEVDREILRTSGSRYLYEHSDAYRNRIDRQVRQKFAATIDEGICSSETGKDIFVDASDQNETTIAINRKDPNLIIAGS